MKKVLIVGSGGREHAIAEAIHRTSQGVSIFAAPGNPGIAEIGTCVDINDDNVEGIVNFAKSEDINLVIVGPEVPLSLGLADRLAEENIHVFGPKAAAARIESSKEFAKEVMVRANVPTASYKTFSSYDEAKDFVATKELPIVIKYDGLAAGKGVVIAQTTKEVDETLRDMLIDDKYGDAKVVIEDFLVGEEFSLFAFVRGREVFPLQPAKDHKRAFDNDEGPNTGGMGAFSPVHFVNKEDEAFVFTNVLCPVAEALTEAGTPFVGLLYAGLIKTKDGIKVIEFNCRFGDPETEVLLPRLNTDFYALAASIAEGNLSLTNCSDVPKLEWKDREVLGVVLASKGYPGSYVKGFPLTEAINKCRGVKVFHMGTKISTEEEIVSQGGRVLMVVAEADNMEEARSVVMENMKNFSTEHFFYRKDIALKK